MVLRRLAGLNSTAKASYADFILGKQPLIRVKCGIPMIIYCDGVSSGNDGVSVAGIFHEDRLILD